MGPVASGGNACPGPKSLYASRGLERTGDRRGGGLSTHAKGFFITLLAVLVISPDGLLVRLVAADIWTLLFWRGLLMGTGIALGLLCLYRGRTWAAFRDLGWPGFTVALLFALCTVAFIVSITNTTVANTLFIVSTSPLFSALIAWRLLGEAVAPRTWGAIALALVGIGIIASGGLDSGSIIGNLAALAAALSLAGGFSLIRRHRDRDMVPAAALSGWMTALLVLPLAQPAAIAGGDVAVLLVMGLVMLPLSFALMTIGPRYLPAPEVGLILLLESILGPLWVWLAIGETPGDRTLLGGAIVIGTLAGHAAWTLFRPPRAAAVGSAGS